MILETGTVINDIYRVVRLLGKGSMGHVYLVERIKDDKKFVVKELNFSQEAGLDIYAAKEIFHREAEFMAKINHPGVPKMYGVFPLDGKDYLTMDYIEGKTLEEIINTSEGPISEENAIKWTVELADILNYLHNSFHQPIVYRDLKPSNIIIKPDGNPVLVDFGIARYYNPDKNSDTFSYGSPGYAAPEQYKGRGQSTPQSDVFGLGVILFQMLTGYDPSLHPLQFPSMKKLNPLISEKLEEIVLKSIQLDPLKRYISMVEFKEILEKYKKPYKFSKNETEEIKKTSSPIAFSCHNRLCSIFKRITIILFVLNITATCKVVTTFPYSKAASANVFWGITSLLIILSSILWTIFMFNEKDGTSETHKNTSITSSKSADKTFSIIILLIMVLSLTFVPNFQKGRADQQFCRCEWNLKKMAEAIELYGTDNNGNYPHDLYKLLRIKKYNNELYNNIPACPQYEFNRNYKKLNSYGYSFSDKYENFTLWCIDGHPDANGEPGFPRYSRNNGMEYRKDR